MKQLFHYPVFCSRSRLLISLAALAVNTSVQAQIITTVAGTGLMGYTGDGAQATAAQLFYATNTAEDAAGNLYIADQNNNVVRKVSTTSVISTVAGNGTIGYSGDGSPATAAQMIYPFAVAVDASGNLFIADMLNYRIRKVNTTGTISTIAGNGTPGFTGDGGPATAAQIAGPGGFALDAAGNLYFADQSNNRIRKITTAGIISTVAGNGTAGYAGNGSAATAAELQDPSAVTFDAAGNMYIADNGNNTIRKVNTSGIISTFAGTSTPGYSGDGGPATAAKMGACYGVAIDAFGNLFLSAPNNNVVRKVSTSGIITTIAGNGTPTFSGDGGPASAAGLQTPQGLMIDHTGKLFISDAGNNVIRKFKVGTLAVEQIERQNNIMLLPNPNRGMFTLTGTLNATSDQTVSFRIMDLTGNLVYENTVAVQKGNINTRIELKDDLPNGMYILNVVAETETKASCFLIEK